MSSDDLFGVLRGDGDRAAVRFERTYDTDREDLWSALTEPERLARWFAPVTGDLRPGGSYEIDFGDEKTPGTIVGCRPPEQLDLTWDLAGEPTSVVVVSLAPLGDRTRLVLDHSRLPLNQAGGYAAGWHAYVDRLDAVLRQVEVPTWDSVFAAQVGRYRGEASALG